MHMLRTGTIIIAVLLICSCADKIVETSEKGDLTVLLNVRSPNPEVRKSRFTSFSTLHIRVLSLDGAYEDQQELDISVGTPVEMAEFDHVPAGSHRVAAWTTDAAGDTIHAPSADTVEITSGEDAAVALTLAPRFGSIMAQLFDLPTSMDSLFFSFASDSGLFEVSHDRSSKLSLSLDKIPFGATGTLSLVCTREDGDTMTSWDTLFTFTGENTAFELSLINNGDVNISVTLEDIPVTTVTGSGDTTVALAEENDAGLVMTEFCATGGGTDGKEYVEIHNTSDADKEFDTLVLTADGDECILADVVIPAGGYFTVGTEGASDVWDCDCEADFGLSSRSGVLMISAGDELFDYVVYFNDYEDAGWPDIGTSAKRSWVLKESELSCEKNNFGSSWVPAESLHNSVEGENWYGTPGASGK
ncbi:MAG: hypothetical protein ACQEQV_05515 [Fibrobacterota bacterium]